MLYSYSFTDDTSSGIVQAFDSATRTITFYYDTDIALSGGTGVEYLDYQVTISATVGFITTATNSATFNLRVKNPCFDPANI